MAVTTTTQQPKSHPTFKTSIGNCRMVRTRANTSALTRQQANRFRGVECAARTRRCEGDVAPPDVQVAAAILLEVKNHSKHNKSDAACARLVAQIQGRQGRRVGDSEQVYKKKKGR